MTECIVKCYACRDEKNQPKRWRYLCEECAEEQGTRHRRETGHSCETVITRAGEPKQAFRMIADASRLMGRRGWWE